MIVDTSAIMTVALEEPDHHRVIEALSNAGAVHISTGTAFELEIVLLRVASAVTTRRAHALLSAAAVATAPFDERQLATATSAYRTYGRGSGHPARLNYGDCFSYALAVTTDRPLLYVGDDFARTDVRSAL